MDDGSPATTRHRRWGSACLTCRKKKIRCDGGKPLCRNCTRTADDCAYKASDAVNNELSAELHRKTDELSNLRHRVRTLGQVSGEERDRAISELLRAVNVPSEPTGACTEERAESNQASELSVDESGHVRPYGATSRFHLRPYEAAVSKPDSGEEEYHRKWLRSNARFQQSWENKALQRLHEPAFADITFEQATILLDIYWTWQAPLHNCIYRRCFYRDMALGGPCFSPFLLYVIFAHASRHVRSDDPRFAGFERGEPFLMKAKGLLVHTLETPTVPTVQGLLLLGGRQCSVGKTSEGWLYTSMATAMIKDMGLHLRRDAGALYKDLEPDDLELRKRLYLSAYLWDKSISLCVGRQPSLPEMPYPRSCLLDDADNTDIWRPVHLGLGDLSDRYPQPTCCHNTENFMSFVELATIVNQVYSVVYGARNRSCCTPATLYDLENRLRTFRDALPHHLRVDTSKENLPSPPPHIFTVNILYRTALILLFRPFYQTPSTSAPCQKLAQHAHEVCTAEAVAVNASFRAYGRTFNFRMQTHLLSYCVYTAASVDVFEMQSKDSDEARAATQRLQVTLHMLEAEAEQTPGVRKSIDIIRSQIKRTPGADDIISTPPTSFELLTPSETASHPSTSLLPSNSLNGAPAYYERTLASSDPSHNDMLRTNVLDSMSNFFSGPFEDSNDTWLLWNDLDISGGFGPSDYDRLWQ